MKCRFCNKEHMQQECFFRINKDAPFVNRNGKPLTGAGQLASVEDDQDQDAELNLNLIRRRSVQDQENRDLNSA
jgi:hypothetical protein